MRRFLALFALLAACESSPPPATETEITGTCIRSFRAVLEAWEAALGRVPEACAYLDADYEVELVGTGELPCDAAPAGSELVGCTQGSVIYLRSGRDDLGLIDTSAHEWTHALSKCVNGTADREHLRAQLWIDYGAASVEAQALAAVVIGRCL